MGPIIQPSYTCLHVNAGRALQVVREHPRTPVVIIGLDRHGPTWRIAGEIGLDARWAHVIDLERVRFVWYDVPPAVAAIPIEANPSSANLLRRDQATDRVAVSIKNQNADGS